LVQPGLGTLVELSPEEGTRVRGCCRPLGSPVEQTGVLLVERAGWLVQSLGVTLPTPQAKWGFVLSGDHLMSSLRTYPLPQ
jgi:hypothetical protein